MACALIPSRVWWACGGRVAGVYRTPNGTLNGTLNGTSETGFTTAASSQSGLANLYRQGATLGANRKHWFGAKFFQPYRLFFRYHAGAQMIVYAWVNVDDTRRACESSDDAYLVFRKMLANGQPPDDWDQ